MGREIETDRLILRTVTADDTDAVFKWASDPDVNRYVSYPLHKDIEFTRKWLGSRDVDGEDEFDLGFELKETGELIGMGGLSYREDIDAWVIGYNIRKEYWGQGLVPEAMNAIVDTVNKEKGIKAIAGQFAKDNSRSRRVMEKLGMTFWKDCTFSKLDGSVTYDACWYRREF